MQRYDVLIVGAGLFGAVCARELTDAGKRVLVLEKRGHIAGNLYTEQIAGIHVHRYGPHIFHTNSDEAWRYACRFAEFAQYVHSPAANFKGEIYPLPFNMHTFRRLWGVSEPQQAAERIARQRGEFSGEPKNLEEQAVALVGRDLFEKLI
ncbi:MAG: FAD-dependent oxidoreductase, partial [Eubacteriales bacterium]|nr:FAD-dependent oxidoreductase [Eubacteriales bacterium]